MHKLYVVHSSHPCVAVKKALELKSISFKTVEMLIPTQMVIQRVRFRGVPTVPAMRLNGGERISGSRAIMRRLDELVPDPPLLPAGDAERAAVLATEQWGEEVLQPLARRVVWGAFKRCPAAIASYQEASQLPRLPRPVLRVVAPGVIAIEQVVHGARADQTRADLRALPGHLDRIDAWIGEGVLGGAGSPSAADLQIGSSLRLLLTIGDLRPLTAGRPAESFATALFEDYPGDVPAGTFPADWLGEH